MARTGNRLGVIAQDVVCYPNTNLLQTVVDCKFKFTVAVADLRLGFSSQSHSSLPDFAKQSACNKAAAEVSSGIFQL